jgi:hypothetical protein
MPPQLAADNNGASMFSNSAVRGVVVVEQAPPLRFPGCVGAVVREFRVAQGLRPGYQFTRDRALRATRADAVLDVCHLTRVPAREEVAENAAVAAHLAIIIGCPLPDAQGSKMRRLERAHLPLVHGVIGNTVDADFAVAPGLRARPFDALVKVLRLARRPHVEIAWRASGAARVDPHAGIAVRHPFLRIDELPVLIFVARAAQHFWRGFDQARPVALVAFLE